MNRVILSIVAFLYLFPNVGYSSDTLVLQSFINQVLEYHPLIQKANLYDDLQSAYGLKGRGALDPKVSSEFNSKLFDNTDYFSIWQTEAKIPTKLPIDFSIGYEKNNGLFLNPENSVPSNGLLYGTLNISFLRGLLFDEQRFQIQMAEINGAKNQIEKEILVREIIIQAVSAYLSWTEAYNQFIISQDYFDLVNNRHLGVIQLFESGDIPAIDTTESRLNINTAQKLLLESRNKLIKRVQELSLFLWDENDNPLRMNDQVIPMANDVLINELLELGMLNNPSFGDDPLIKKIDNSVERIELKNRLEREQLKPQLDLKYNTILNLGKEELDPSLSLSNYKYGIGFSYPIANRKTKGEIKLNEARINQEELGKTQYLASLTNKFEGLLAQRDVLVELLEVIQEKVANSQLLYEAENIKFNLGESSIFLLNQRERKLLEARKELAKLYLDLSNNLNELYYLKLGQI